MGGKNQVLLTFAGDATSLDKTLKGVGAGSERMGKQVGESSSKLDRLGEAGGNTETRFLGLGAGISGVTTLLSGDLNAETAAMAMADLGDAVEHTVVPLITQGKTLLANGANALVSAGQHTVAAAQTAAAWVVMGFQATVNAAKMAVAWIISLGPIALVIAAVAAVIAILIKLGVGFDDLKRWAGAAWGFVKNAATSAKDWVGARVGDILGFFGSIPGKIGSFFSGLADTIKAPFVTAFGAIKSLWNSTAGGFGFSVPGWLPGIGGKSFHIPKMHGGGLVPGAPGQEVLRILQAGERVTAAGQSAGGPTVIVNVAGNILSDRDLVKVIRDEITRGGFGGAL
jgi:hypothetical protein